MIAPHAMPAIAPSRVEPATAPRHGHPAGHLALEDGRGVTIRAARPGDEALTQAFVRALSDQSRYHRFLVGLRELPPRLLTRMTAVDQVNHVALLAEALVYGKPVQVGEARYVVDGAHAQVADFAIAVADDWQQAGIGSRLLRTLEVAARAGGLRLLVGDVLGSNARALEFMRERGFSIRTNREEPRLMRVEKALDAAR
jgi:acetyltransferase